MVLTTLVPILMVAALMLGPIRGMAPLTLVPILVRAALTLVPMLVRAALMLRAHSTFVIPVRIVRYTNISDNGRWAADLLCEVTHAASALELVSKHLV
jgi:hypothetical protein